MKKTVVEMLKEMKPREALDRKEYKEFYNGLSEVLDVVYPIYQAREKGEANAKTESEAMAKITEFLHTLGKANGKYISVCEKTTENGIASVLFDTLIYHSFKDRIYTTSEALATLEAEKSTASKAKAEAHTKLINGKGTAKEYKEAVKAYEAVISKIEAERAKAGAENEMVCKESKSKFQKFAIARLKAIVNNRYALSEEEAEALRKTRNKEAKAQRKAQRKAKPQTEAKAEKKTA